MYKVFKQSILLAIVVSLASIVLTSCHKEEKDKMLYWRIELSGGATSPTTASLTVKIVAVPGSEAIYDNYHYLGVIWSDKGDPKNEVWVSSDNDGGGCNKQYTTRFMANLKPDTKYYVRGYMQFPFNDEISYGDLMWFSTGKSDNYEPGNIPGLGNTPGNLTGESFSLPNVWLSEEITGAGHYNDYWDKPIEEPEIHYYGSGKGYVDLLLKLSNAGSTSITVTFPAATIFVSKTGNCQNGILLKEVKITIPANSYYYLCLSLYCGNKHKSAAGSNDVYNLGVISDADPLIDLCNKLKNKKINIEKFSRTNTEDRYTYNSQIDMLQNILWKVTDGNGLTQGDIEYINSLPNN